MIAHVETAIQKRAAYRAEWNATHPEQVKAYRASWRAKHREQIAAYNSAYFVTHRKELTIYKRLHSHPEYRIAYYQSHREKIKAASSAYRAEHPEKRRNWDSAHPGYYAAYHATHRDQKRENQHRRRVRIRGGFVEPINVEILAKRDNELCGICGNQVSLNERSIDHILPISKGGAHSYQNTRLTHLSCNVARGNRDVITSQERTG